jgi:biotin carboxyl carrier protein
MIAPQEAFHRRCTCSILSSVSVIGSLWRIGLPLAVVASSALVLVSAVRVRDEPSPSSRPAAAFAVLVWLKLAGEAAFGDQRPVFERQWKGAAALLLALAFALHLHQRYRRRGRDEPTPTAAVARSAPHSDLAVFVTMPALGEHVLVGTVTRWLKQVGDTVTDGEPLAEISTDKVDTEIPAVASGVLLEIRAAAGTSAPVGTVIAVIEPLAER